MKLEECVTIGKNAEICKEFLSEFENNIKNNLYECAINNSRDTLERIIAQAQFINNFKIMLNSKINAGKIAQQELLNEIEE